MKANLGKPDRALRLIAGMVLVGLAMTGVIGAWGYLGLIFVVTALINFCPIYRLLNISTKKDS
ncbi:MAG: DUF2892 domain-containing protein [Moraxella sp.]|nr:DUF2892 domain-containing protein [Moraxella sp.]